jgi:hypothetical protein
MRNFNLVVDTGARVKAERLHNIFKRAKDIGDRLVLVGTAVEGELQQLGRGGDATDYLDFFADEFLEIEIAAHDLEGAVLLIKNLTS